MPSSLTPTSSTGLAYPRILGWSVKQHIGGGGFSKVFRGLNPAHVTHRVAAIKVVSLLRSPPPDRRALQKEIQIHAVLKHPHILKFLGVEERGVTAQERGRYLPGIYMVLELAGGGDLFDKITPDVGVETDLAHFYFTQLMAGLEYIHQQGVAHRDVKPENMLLDNEGNLKIADFGLCAVYKHKGREREMKGACGSLPYIAPEMNGRPYKGEPVDVWSAGCVLFALLVGNTPWDEPTSRAPEYVAYLDGSLLEYDPWNRIPGDEMSLLKGMLTPDPSRRLGIEAIKRHRWFTRRNSLLEPGSSQCNDPASLAERLLQGLIVNGEMDYAAPLSVEERAKELHSDGGRADVTDQISFTQPEAVTHPGQSSLTLGSGSSMALGSTQGPLMRHAGPSRPRRSSYAASLSQQFQTRRSEFQQSQQLFQQSHGADIGAGMSSQFTEALNFFTQQPTGSLGGSGRSTSQLWGSGATSALHMTPNLTRFTTRVGVSVIAARLCSILHSMRIQYVVEPLGDSVLPSGDEDEASQDLDSQSSTLRPDSSASSSGTIMADLRDHQEMDLDGDQSANSTGMTRSTSDSSDALTIKEAGASSTTAAPSIPVGSKGSRIRLGLMDRRKCQLRGEIRIETLAVSEAMEEDSQGSAAAASNGPQCLVLMRRSRGNPLEWRRVFGQVVKERSIWESIWRP